MKSKTMWCFAVLAMGNLFLLSGARAYSLEGYNHAPVATYRYSATDSSLPQYQKVPQYQVQNGPVNGVPNKQRTVAQQQPMTPTTNKPILSDNRTNRPSQAIAKSSAKKKQAQNAATRSNQKKIDQHQLLPAAYSNYPNQAAQYRNLPQKSYYQAPATGYYGNPYETQYTTAPNYYQGYSNRGWGSSGQACAPGQA